MFLFRKTERKYIEMRFILDDFSVHEFDNERCLIDIEAYGEIDGKVKYCYSSFSLKNPQMYENGDFESMLNLLRASDYKTVLVELKYRNGRFKGFQDRLSSQVQHNQRKNF